jgi:pilus assembly protein CpaE
VTRPAVVVALPPAESGPVVSELTDAGFETFPVKTPEELEAVLDKHADIGVAILDGETDLDASLESYSLLHEAGRKIPALMVVSPSSFDRLVAGAPESAADEYFTRPYTADALRWRVEAMSIRSQTVDDGSGPILTNGAVVLDGWTDRRATVVAVFNPKGGVGKTTVATNLAATLQIRRGRNVLLVDGDTVTGHVTTSLGLDSGRTVADSWRDEAEGGPMETLAEIAAAHVSGMRVVALTDSPLETEILEPERVAAEINAARSVYDVIVVDLHPSYSLINQAIFGIADRILVPVTPDVPAIRAAVQLRDVAVEGGFRDNLALVINRANSGVGVADMERTVGMPALALIRSGGLLFVRAANEGRTVIEMFPKERITADFDVLADALFGIASPAGQASKPGLRLFARQKEAVGA